MSNDDLTRALAELFRAIVDPTAPLPFFWPSGAAGAFLMFVMPLAAGIPFGVIMARDAGVSPLGTAGLYLVSDFVMALVAEPMLVLLRRLAKRVVAVGRTGRALTQASSILGLNDGRVRGPLGLIVLSFSLNPILSRAASVAAGHGFLVGWALAIIGDMIFFGMLMATTLWVANVFGDSRQIIGALALGVWLLPMLIQRLRRGSGSTVRSKPATLRVAPAIAGISDAGSAVPSRGPRRRVSHSGRRRPSRGLHR